ncbi:MULTISPECIES: hypothetical protein [unclassified Idiomarina]|jgi:hypothetical protein|uniref:hypothetical protein n=1 Tax=Idiomarina sp. TaxID=1874361 RepID=UPI000B15958C|nr:MULTISPECIES: hypothetical protein [unclassified Idiomarina]MBF37623.1 hypothetical protein [Idiomarinaceae bacterium]MCJ8317959.1 hypothetical protein [Idiomarina sp.]NQZ17613.1 hypothetical protein [Idiomarina sp.]
MRRNKPERLQLSLSKEQLKRLLLEKRLVASDIRCCDYCSQCELKELILECTRITCSSETRNMGS